MTSQHTACYPLYKRIAIISISLFLTLTLTSACYCEDDQKKSAENNILLLKFNQHDGDFTAGREYSYFNDTDTFTINLNQEKLGDRTITSLHYTEMNALLFKAETTHDGAAGTIQIPQDFRDETSFERTETNTLIAAKSYKVLTGEDIGVTDFEDMWLKIQDLSTVRTYLETNPEQEVNIFSYHPTSDKNSDDSQWIVVLKN